MTRDRETKRKTRLFRTRSVNELGILCIFSESGFLENEPTVPAESRHTPHCGSEKTDTRRKVWLELRRLPPIMGFA